MRCRCTNPCTCYFEYDGDRPNTFYTLPYEKGRYNTRREGTGTAVDPYIIEFLDSEEFRVEAGQVRSTNPQTISSFTGVYGHTALQINQIDYETPNEIFLGFNLTGTPPYKFQPSAHRFWFASAQATFVYNGTTAGHRRLYIQYVGPNGQFVSAIAGVSSTGLAEDITLSCSGSIPFMNSTTPGEGSVFTNGIGGNILIGLTQGSGIDMVVQDIRLTLVAL